MEIILSEKANGSGFERFYDCQQQNSKWCNLLKMSGTPQM